MAQSDPENRDSIAPDADDRELEDDDDVFFRDVSEDLDDEERTSYAILLILAIGGFALGGLLLSLTFTTARTLQEYVGDMGWVFAPAPMLLFGLASIWQYEVSWLQRLGAAALGFALAQYVMLAIGFAVLEV